MMCVLTKRHCSELRDPGQLKSLRTLINRSGSHLETLQLEASIQAKRAQIIESILPNDLKHEVATGDLNSGILTLYIPQAALASRLRFEEYSLIDVLKQDPLFRGIRRIQCRVRPRKFEEAPRNSKSITPNPKAGASIEEFSETIEDLELKRQFQRLAARVSGNPLPDQK
jgi:hypothetical protein